MDDPAAFVLFGALAGLGAPLTGLVAGLLARRKVATVVFGVVFVTSFATCVYLRLWPWEVVAGAVEDLIDGTYPQSPA